MNEHSDLISSIVGIEADLPLSVGDTWKQYYRSALQIGTFLLQSLTKVQWTFASAPDNAILATTIHEIVSQIQSLTVEELEKMNDEQLTGVTGPGTFRFLLMLSRAFYSSHSRLLANHGC